MADSNAVATEKASANNEINKSIRDLLSLKMTLPLGNPNLKNVHTNQFLWYDLPSEFKMQYMKTVSDAMQSTYNRYAKYEEGKWYIEGVTITNDGNKFTMELDLNPFASSLVDYRDEYQSFTKAYQDLSSKENTVITVKSTKNTTLKGGQGKVIDGLVEEICGNETDALKKCKLIHEWLKKNVRYKRYCCAKYKTAEQCYNNRKSLNCADTSTLTCRMMLSAGLKAYIVHRTYNGGHFWTIIEINGKKYASDQTGDGSAFNTVWKSSGRTTVSDGGSYSRKNGDFPDCYPSYSC